MSEGRDNRARLSARDSAGSGRVAGPVGAGFRWLNFGVNHAETEEVLPFSHSDHALYLLRYPRQKPERHPAMTDGTFARLCQETEWAQVAPLLDRSSRGIRGMAAAQGRLF